MAWQDRAKNAAEGALTGASIGSVTGNPYVTAGSAVVGGIWGGFSDVSEQEMARRMLSGEVDPVAAQALSRALHKQYDTLRRETGQDYARRGLYGSTFAAGAMGRIGNSERMAYSQALASHQLARQRLGAQIQAAQQYSTSQTGSNALQALELSGVFRPGGGGGTNKKAATGTGIDPIGVDPVPANTGIASIGSGGNISKINNGGFNNNPFMNWQQGGFA